MSKKPLKPSDESRKSSFIMEVSDGVKNAVLKIGGPGNVVLLALWLVAVVVVCVYADKEGRFVGILLLGFFIAAYFSALRRL